MTIADVRFRPKADLGKVGFPALRQSPRPDLAGLSVAARSPNVGSDQAC